MVFVVLSPKAFHACCLLTKVMKLLIHFSETIYCQIRQKSENHCGIMIMLSMALALYM